MAIIRNGMTYDVETVLQKVQSDWNQTDDTQLDFIKNKPNINGAIGELIDEMNANSVMGVAHDITEDGAARLTFTGISQTNGVIGVGEGTETLVFEKIATNAVAGNFTVDYTYSNGVVGTITGQEATDDITERLVEIETLPTYETIICSTAQNTPEGVVWVNEQHETVTGLLAATAGTMHRIYFVRQNATEGDVYDEYITTKAADPEHPGEFIYNWEKIGSTAGVFEGVEEVADGLIKDATVNTTEGHYMIVDHKLVQAAGEPIATYTKSPDDGLTMASDVKGYVDSTALLTEDIEVMGVEVGTLSSGTELKAGSSLTEILKDMLQKVIGTEVNANPSIKLNGIASTDHEVGDNISNFTISAAVDNKGSYKSAKPEVFKLKYGKDSEGHTINANDNGILTANCTIGNVAFTANPNPVGTSVNPTTGEVEHFTVIEGTNVTLRTTASASSDITPYKNNDKPDDGVRIDSVAVSASKTITGKYKYWYGYCKYNPDPSYNYDDIFTFENNQLTYDSSKATMQSAWYTAADSTGRCKIGTMTTLSDFPCAVLILPKTFRVADDAHGHIQSIEIAGITLTGDDADAKFATANTPTYKCNESADPITYVVRVKKGGEPQTYKEIYIK